MKPDAETMHEQMCGKWIDAGPTMPTEVRYWSFYDSVDTDRAVLNADRALYSSSRLSATDMGKFYASCTHTILGGSSAIRSSGKEAYTYLKTGLKDITSVRRVLEAAGWLSSFSCDGPVQVGVSVGDGAFKATAYRGSEFDKGSLAEALYVLDEPLALQNLAEAGNDLVNANAFSSPMTTFSQIEWLFEGSTGRTDHDTVPLKFGVTPELDGLVWLATQPRFGEAGAYLHGVAAMCAFALQGSMDIDAAADWTSRAKAIKRIRAAKPEASALGRLSNKRGSAPLRNDPTNETLAQATTVTFSQLRAEPAGVPERDCTALASFLFPDRMDQEHFGLIVTEKLYERLQTMTATLRASVAHVVQNHPNISYVILDTASVAATVQSTLVRVAGAPRGSWAGIQRGFSDGNLRSTDGPMLMALRQAKAIFNDRMTILFDDANLCTGPPAYDALEANAYIYPAGKCTHFMLGILRKPFADERYDDASLATRFGYIVAHELGHNTLNSAWSASGTAALLHRYTSNLYAEAMADLVAVLAIIHAGYATGKEVCEHVSQVWCARVPITYAPSNTDSHPGPNFRGDALCETLADLGEL